MLPELEFGKERVIEIGENSSSGNEIKNEGTKKRKK
jgi:hypothetical protein